jgi:radical SAM-linked protein
MTDAAPFRYRLTFGKTAAMRFTGHLDLQRTVERTLRRARLPLGYTQGFSPHPRINLGAALPLGCTSEADLADIWLEMERPPGDVLRGLQESIPPGLRVSSVERIVASAPALQAIILSSDYVIRLPPEESPQDLRRHLQALLEASTLPRQRRGRSYDLRPLIERLEATGRGDGVELGVRLAAREGATGRPEEVLLALGIDPAEALIHRRGLVLAGPEAEV